MPPRKSSETAELIKGWSSELEKMLSYLETMPGEYLNDDLLQRLGIHVSSLDLETDKASDWAPQFFRPFPREHMKISSCVVDSPEHTGLPEKTKRKKYSGDFELGSVLSFVIEDHFRDIRLEYPTKWEPVNADRYKGAEWCWTSGQQQWQLQGALDFPGRSKPHLKLSVLSDCYGDGRLVRSELIAMTSFMWAGMKLQRLKAVGQRHSNIHIRIPVLVISTLNPLQLRVLQGHFDGMLRIQCSKLYNFDVPDHQEVMDLFMRWKMPTPCWNTTLNTSLLSECPEDEPGACGE